MPPSGGWWSTARDRLAALVALPLLFRQLGTVGFGQYSMIIALAGFGNAANLGAAVTATKLVSERAHEPGGTCAPRAWAWR
ncbi:hypothetical protein WJ968_13750 [Achromobacter xylosoxidans]